MMRYLALDGGATHTAAGLYAEDGTLLGESQGPPANPVAYGLPATLSALNITAAPLLSGLKESVVVLAGVSGARSADYWHEIAQGLCDQLDVERAVVTTDIHPLIEANAMGKPALLAVSGTGATVLGRDAQGHIYQIGGRGRLLGEEGSAYAIALNGLRGAAHAIDGIGPKTMLVEMLTRAAGLDDFDDLIGWTAIASKRDMASLSQVVDAAAAEGDKVAQLCIEEQARWLAVQVATLQERMHLDELGEDTPVFLHGGVFESCKPFRWSFTVALDDYSHLTLKDLEISSHRSIMTLAHLDPLPPWAGEARSGSAEYRLPRTEQRAELAKPLDRMTPLEIVGTMNREDKRAVRAVAQQADRVAAIIEKAGDAIRRGGRIVYVGAGTSGRLAVLDASECPPTFGVSPGRVVALIAGGDAALRHSVEGAEDDREKAVAEVRALAVNARDIVVGVTASGTTPYVLAALEEAAALGAHTALVCSNPARATRVGMVVAMDTGPEVLAGSTRLKAGTASKLVLNMISTGAMALAGYVHEGMMVGMVPVNKKLRHRALRMIAALAGVEQEQAESLLAQAGNRIAVAVILGKRGGTVADAEAYLGSAGGLLGPALQRLSAHEQKVP